MAPLPPARSATICGPRPGHWRSGVNVKTTAPGGALPRRGPPPAGSSPLLRVPAPSRQRRHPDHTRGTFFMRERALTVFGTAVAAFLLTTTTAPADTIITAGENNIEWRRHCNTLYEGPSPRRMRSPTSRTTGCAREMPGSAFPPTALHPQRVNRTQTRGSAEPAIHSFVHPSTLSGGMPGRSPPPARAPAESLPPRSSRKPSACSSTTAPPRAPSTASSLHVPVHREEGQAERQRRIFCIALE